MDPQLITQGLAAPLAALAAAGEDDTYFCFTNYDGSQPCPSR